MIHLVFLLICEIIATSGLSIKSSNLVIIQNKGGGHGSIGYNLCKDLVVSKPSLNLHLVQDSCDYNMLPFKLYDRLLNLGVDVTDCSMSDLDAINSLWEKLTSLHVEVIVDNWSKDVNDVKKCLQLAKSAGVKQYIFISSAGMYQPSAQMPLVEADLVKINDARKIELEIIKSDVPFTFMRPQYIYGPTCSKRYLDYFIGRSIRGLPVPVPLHGDQLVCLTHEQDTAALIASAIGNPAALQETFNCGSDRYISYRNLVGAIHKVTAPHRSPASTTEEEVHEPRILSYDPSAYPHWDGSGVQVFPFRSETFVASSSKAQRLLGWRPRGTVAGGPSVVTDLTDEVAQYVASGGAGEQWSNGRETKHDAEVSTCQLSISNPR